MKKVEYIKSTSYTYNKNYIKTGIFPTNKTKLEMKMQALTTDSHSYDRLFGSSDKFRNQLSSAPPNIAFYWNGASKSISNMSGNAIHVLTQDRNVLYMDDVQVASWTDSTWSDSSELRLFSATTGDRDGVFMLYYCKIWEDDVLVRDFIPVLDESETPCLYDKVTQTYFYNCGTTAFLAGAVLKPDKYYYNGVLLPDIPEELKEKYQYFWIRKNKTTGNFDLVASENVQYYTSSDSRIWLDNGNQEWWIAPINGAEEWEYYKSYAGKDWWGINDSQYVMWASYNIPNGSATSTDIYFKGSEPTENQTTNLINQFQTSVNGVTSLELNMDGLTVGNMLIASIVMREEKDPVLTDGWQILGKSTGIVDSGYTQHCIIACKLAVSSTESLLVTQKGTNRIYMVCAEISNVVFVNWNSKLNVAGTTSNFSVDVSKEPDKIILYSVHSNYYNSGAQSCAPNDLVKVKGDASAERLASWFDDGSGAVSHTFQTSTGSDFAEVCGVELYNVEITGKYLIKDGEQYYNIINGALNEVAINTLRAESFIEYGFEEIPDGSLLIGLEKPTVLYWQDNDEAMPEISATVTATPFPQTLYSSKVMLTDTSIKGIETVTLEATGNPTFAVSLDGIMWKAMLNGVWVELSESETGMQANVLKAITMEQWNELIKDASYIILRFTLASVEDSVTNIMVDFLN